MMSSQIFNILTKQLQASYAAGSAPEGEKASHRRQVVDKNSCTNTITSSIEF